ncbi:MAG: hypothetical protein AAF228_03970 [Pseudomonadota bacterium]
MGIKLHYPFVVWNNADHNNCIKQVPTSLSAHRLHSRESGNLKPWMQFAIKFVLKQGLYKIQRARVLQVQSDSRFRGNYGQEEFMLSLKSYLRKLKA